MWKAQLSRRDDAPGAVHQEGVGISLEVFAVPPKTIEQFQFQHLSAILTFRLTGPKRQPILAEDCQNEVSPGYV
jgi:hypothetical protein